MGRTEALEPFECTVPSGCDQKRMSQRWEHRSVGVPSLEVTWEGMLAAPQAHSGPFGGTQTNGPGRGLCQQPHWDWRWTLSHTHWFLPVGPWVQNQGATWPARVSVKTWGFKQLSLWQCVVQPQKTKTPCITFLKSSMSTFFFLKCTVGFFIQLRIT